MAFDLMANLIVLMRTNVALVAAFGDNPMTPKFWSNYSALHDYFIQDHIQDQEVLDVMPYLVFTEPQETKTYESKDSTGNPSAAAIGLIVADGYASTEILARELGEQLCSVLNDCDESISNLFYFRRSSQAMP